MWQSFILENSLFKTTPHFISDTHKLELTEARCSGLLHKGNFYRFHTGGYVIHTTSGNFTHKVWRESKPPTSLFTPGPVLLRADSCCQAPHTGKPQHTANISQPAEIETMLSPFSMPGWLVTDIMSTLRWTVSSYQRKGPSSLLAPPTHLPFQACHRPVISPPLMRLIPLTTLPHSAQEFLSSSSTHLQ